MYELMVEDTFDAAHALRGYHGPCENLHGHTWRVQLFLQGTKLNKIGIFVDFKEVRKILAQHLSRFDHHNLNELSEFAKINPSSENLARYLYKKIKSELKPLVKVTVWESRETSASYWE